MAKIPQLSSSAAPVVAPLRGQLSLPTNFSAPVTSRGVSNAFAALAKTASNLGEFKQQIFDREQNTYSDRFNFAVEDALNNVLSTKVQELDSRLKDVDDPFTIADGDSFVYDAIEGWFSDKNNYAGLEGVRSLTPSNQDAVLNRQRRVFRNAARQQDTALRGRGEAIAAQANIDNNLRVVGGTSLEYQYDEANNVLGVNSEYAKAVNKGFLHLISVRANQESFDRFSNVIVNRFLSPDFEEIFLTNPGSYSEHAKAVIDLLSDSEGNPYSPTAVDQIRDYEAKITKQNIEAHKKFIEAKTKAFISKYSDLSNRQVEGDPDDFSDFSRQYQRAADLVAQGELGLKSFGNELKNDETFVKLHNTNLENLRSSELIQPFIQGELPNDHVFLEGLSKEEKATQKENYKNMYVSQKLLVAETYYRNLKDQLPLLKDATEEEEFTRKVLDTAIKRLEKYKLNYTGESYFKDAYNDLKTMGNVAPEDLMKLVGVGRQIGGNRFDPASLKGIFSGDEILAMADYNNRLRTDETFRNRHSLEDIEAFQGLISSAAGGTSEAQMQIFSGRTIEGLDEINSNVPSYARKITNYAQLFGFDVGAAYPELTDKIFTYAHSQLVQDPDFLRDFQKYEDMSSSGRSAAAKKALGKELQTKLLKSAAALSGRTYVSFNNQALFLNSEQFPATGLKNLPNKLEALRYLASNTAFGPKLAGVVDELKKGGFYSTEPTIEGASRYTQYTKEEAIKMLEEVDLSGTHPSVYAGLLDAVKNAPTGPSIPRVVGQYLDAMRDGSRLTTSSAGDLYVVFKPHESGSEIRTRSFTLASIPTVLGKEGMDYAMAQGFEGFRKYTRAVSDFFGDVFGEEGTDVEDLPVDTLVEGSIDYIKRSDKILEIADFSDSAVIGNTVTEDAEAPNLIRVKKYPQNFKAYQLEQPLADSIKDEQRSSNVRRTPGFTTSYEAMENAHVGRRSLGPAFDMAANQLDVIENFESSSIAWNQQIQEAPERQFNNEIFKWIDENDTKGLVGRWTMVTYAPEIPQVEKGEGLFNLMNVEDVPTLSHIVWQFQVVDPKTGAVVNTWKDTITDDDTLSLMSRNQLFVER